VRIRWKDEVRDVEPAASGCDTRVALTGRRLFIWWHGRSWEFTEDKGSASPTAARRSDSSGGLLSPMPGRIRQVLVAEGDRVAKGQVLLVLEAMKMEHAIRSPHDGRVTKLAFGEGDLVDAGAVLADVSSDSSDSM
jgi:acetyl/propionyl-CoA carboxylase alpha subunit